MQNSMYVIKQEKFEGPLDLLFNLIEEEKLSISEISLAQVTDDYIKYVKSLEKIDPEALAEFLLVAAQLMLIKSKSLLPNLAISEEDEKSIEDLERKLEEYRKIRELSKEIKKLEQERGFIYTREAYIGIESIFYPPPKITTGVLMNIFQELLAAIPKIEKLAEDKIKKILTLEEKIDHIRLFLQESIEKSFSEIIRNAKDKVEVLVSFLAILELAKEKFLDLSQNKLFDDIKIRKIT